VCFGRVVPHREQDIQGSDYVVRLSLDCVSPRQHGEVDRTMLPLVNTSLRLDLLEDACKEYPVANVPHTHAYRPHSHLRPHPGTGSCKETVGISELAPISLPLWRRWLSTTETS
jgi:hypothetical protein